MNIRRKTACILVLLIALGLVACREQNQLDEINSILDDWSMSDFAKFYSLERIVVYEADSSDPQVLFVPSERTPRIVDDINYILNNSSVDLVEVTARFNENNGTNFQLSSPLSVYDMDENIRLFIYVHEELLRERYLRGYTPG